MSWQDFGEDEAEDDEPALTVGDALRDGDHVVLAFRAEPETFESDYGEGVRAEATFLDCPSFTWEHDDGTEIQNGDDVVLVTWSSRLVGALASAHDNESIVGDAFKISKSGSGYDVSWTATRVDET